ncbi:hypothetical protein KI387_005365 [Taxus chinensis]|uniref:Fe2OG dioxygenase domain-containing protein n=1 Tax=Taxus chinensis TaxID=29808 RepID=A0AA38GNN7_TAXCH|nr:hypothetical protein KI387_005365 [Taxus chinensis]
MPSSLKSPIEIPVNELDLPLIDISEFPLEFGDHLQNHPEVTKLRDACREWGFFRLVNHGIPVDLLQKVQTVAKELLSMPTEARDRATDSCPAESYVRKPTYESFCFLDLPNSDSVQKISARIWPGQGNSIFCETVGKYSSSATDLASKIMKVILATLNLDVETFYRSDFENCKAYLRINGYPSDGKSIGEEALFSHADVGCLTILLGDEKEGLEIRSKEGKWFSVKPVSDTLVVNVGDSLKAWSNGRYRSSHHRVVCKGWTDRMSIALFYVFPNDKKIWAPAELVDEEINPRRYKSFTFSDFTHKIRHNTEVIDKLTALERFAGI